MKKILSFLTFISFLIFSACVSHPESVSPTVPEVSAPIVTDTAPIVSVQPEPIVPPPLTNTENKDEIVAQFDTVSITKETFQNTKSEMAVVVEELNKITLAKDYEQWLTWLSDEYIQTYSDPIILDRLSANLPSKGIKLKTLKDYFDYVFVPSRQNMRVDDIQFVSPTRVYVIMEITPKSPVAIYIIEKMPNGWKLVLKNK